MCWHQISTTWGLLFYGLYKTRLNDIMRSFDCGEHLVYHKRLARDLRIFLELFAMACFVTITIAQEYSTRRLTGIE